MERLLPPAGHVLLENVLRALGGVGVELLGEFAVIEALPVVVAGDEELGDGASVGVFVVWEHGVPGLGDGQEVGVQALVGHVARDDDGVDVLAAEPLERVLEGEVVAEGAHLLVRSDAEDVDVGDDAELQLRRACGGRAAGSEEPAAAERAERAERRAADEELPS